MTSLDLRNLHDLLHLLNLDLRYFTHDFLYFDLRDLAHDLLHLDLRGLHDSLHLLDLYLRDLTHDLLPPDPAALR